VQAVDPVVDPALAALLGAVEARTGRASLAQAPFALPGEPPVAGVADAWTAFLRGPADALAIGPLLVRR
jgi:predicted NodU family carbamoyl transferase